MRVLLIGASGRLGSEIEAVLREEKWEVRSLRRSDVQRASDVLAEQTNPYVIIDVSLPEGTVAWSSALASLARPVSSLCRGYLAGTTGLSCEQERMIDALSQAAPWSLVSNFSAGVHLFTELLAAKTSSGLTVADLARALGFDLALWEAHHTRKLDAPSGTAKTLAAAAGVAEDRVSATRVGQIVGEHTLFLAGDSEELRISHVAHTRRLFARGAVEMAKRLFANPQAPGRLSKGAILSLPTGSPTTGG